MVFISIKINIFLSYSLVQNEKKKANAIFNKHFLVLHKNMYFLLFKNVRDLVHIFVDSK